MTKLDIRARCASHRYYVITDGDLSPAHILPKLLGALRELAPAAYEQMVSPGCGFAAVPSYALEDERSEWWNGDEQESAMRALFEALAENAPDGTTFEMFPGIGRYGFYSPSEPEPRTRDERDDDLRAVCITAGDHMVDRDGDGACNACGKRDSIDAPSPNVIEVMMFWHGGQGSPLYAAASTWFAGRTVDVDTARRALDELDSMSSQPHFSDADAEALETLRRHIEER